VTAVVSAYFVDSDERIGALVYIGSNDIRGKFPG
jgi:hypothetical protein